MIENSEFFKHLNDLVAGELHPQKDSSMEVPLELTFRSLERDDDIEDLIRSKAEGLKKICHSIVSCRVAVESPHEHQQSGSPYWIRINVRVPPGQDLVVKRTSRDGYLHETLTAVVSSAFDAAYRQLRKLMDKQKGQVKSHPRQEVQALVVQLKADKGYGFIKTREGRELYFHRNSVLNDAFDRLQIGTGVSYVAAEGEQGPEASTVQIVDKPAK
jgi:cold shock CspA family protein